VVETGGRGGSGGKGDAGAPSLVKAAAASIRPWRTADPIDTADCSIALVTSAGVAVGLKERARPATPATSGVAEDVPQKFE
jgi:hypothetical protein